MQWKSLLICCFVTLLAAGCQHQPPEQTLVRELSTDLRRACVARAGGPAMDAVDIFGGRLHHQCARWAEAQAQHRLP